MTPTFQSQLNTTQEQRQEWREVYAYQVKHGEESAAVDASRILVLLADLDTALATWTFSPCAAKATCAAKAQATCPKCKAPYDG